MSRRNRRIDNFPPNYSSFGPLQSYLLHAHGLKTNSWIRCHFETWTLYFRYNSRPRIRILSIFLVFSNQFHISSPFVQISFLSLSLSLILNSFHHDRTSFPRKIRWKKNTVFPFFYNSVQQTIRILDDFLYVNLIRLSILLSVPLFIPKYLFISHPTFLFI